MEKNNLKMTLNFHVPAEKAGQYVFFLTEVAKKGFYFNLKKEENYHDDHSVDVKIEVTIESPEDLKNIVNYLNTLITDLIGVKPNNE